MTTTQQSWISEELTKARKEVREGKFGKLTEFQALWFGAVYKKHLSAMGTEMSKKYSVENLKAIKFDIRENCLKVYFKNGDWWHYDVDHTWY